MNRKILSATGLSPYLGLESQGLPKCFRAFAKTNDNHYLKLGFSSQFVKFSDKTVQRSLLSVFFDGDFFASFAKHINFSA